MNTRKLPLYGCLSLLTLICLWQVGSAADVTSSTAPLNTASAPPAIFQKKCSLCHGTGSGNLGMAKMLHVAPEKMDLTKANISDDSIRTTITKGKGKMPAVTSLSDSQLKELIDYVGHVRASSTDATTPSTK